MNAKNEAKTEQQQAREEILAALDMVLGDGKTVNPDALEALHSLAIAAREYLQAERDAEEGKAGG